MIPRKFIQEWTKFVEWQEPRQIEQDLIITAALLKIYESNYLKEHLAFRGGTALNKLFFKPASRYSEDIDLVQTKNEPIGKTIDHLRSCMDPWLGTPKRSFSDGGVTLAYRVISDDGFPIRLKLEINTKEHFAVLGLANCLFESQSSWPLGSGSTQITTFAIEELLATKLRALYQRRKGRDVYDLYIALRTIKPLDCQKLIHCFHEYMKFGGHTISQKLFIANMDAKMQNQEFLSDMVPLLQRGSSDFDPNIAYEWVKELLIKRI
jgi:predicted nucleotidyltransferase component of viral defense system